MNTIKDYLILFAKGVCMGAADVVPGVSGGTIAFISGIYEELLRSLKSINSTTLKILFSFRFYEFWKAINGKFLLTLFLGIVISLISLAKLVNYLLDEYPIQVWSFFFGLVLISSFTVLRKVSPWSWKVILVLILSTLLSFWITLATPSSTPEAWWFVFLSGMLAICAMILPGVSGAFILLILGKYKYVTTALHNFDIQVIIVFVTGCLAGLMSFVRVVYWVLSKYYNVAIAILSGFMIGSLNKVWPWKEILTYRIASDGSQVPAMDRSILPNSYQELTGNDPKLLQALLLMALGIGLVVILEKIATTGNKL